MKQSQKGFVHLALVLVLFVVVAAGVIYYVVARNRGNAPNGSGATKTVSASCPDPVLRMPVDIQAVTAVLYPGQTRGQYKPHGGFRLDNSSNNAVNVKSPMDAKLVDGSRYIEQGQQQVLLDFQSDCGVNFRFDHLLTLSPNIQAAVDTLPAAKPDDSRTTNLSSPVTVKAGEVIATGVGFPNTHNVSFDFGVYDTRQPNAASKDAAYVAAHPDLSSNDQLKYAVCWFDYLSKSDAAILKALPAGDQNSGKTSDYCK